MANKFKHTPGPWQVSGGRRSDSLYGHGVGPDGAVYVALVTYSDRTTKDHIASLADARLIAAAPDLLDVAKIARNLVEYMLNARDEDGRVELDRAETCDLSDHLAAIDSALSKATGQ